MMKRTTLLVAGLLLVSTVATAGRNWQTFTFSTTPASLPKVLAAPRGLSRCSSGCVGIPASIRKGWNVEQLWM